MGAGGGPDGRAMQAMLPSVQLPGLPACRGHYRHDWQRRCRWGLQEIFGSMSVDEVRLQPHGCCMAA